MSTATARPASAVLKPGLVSVTFRKLPAEEIIKLAVAAGLRGIEWGGDVHVPPGDLANAQRVGSSTRAAGLEVAAYGSYFRLGQSRANGLSFTTVLQTAQVLGAELIRIWAGRCNSEQVEVAERQAIVAEAREIAAQAAAGNVRLAFEFHADTLTNTAASCRTLLEEINHPNLRTLWQPEHGLGAEQNCAGLQSLSPWLAGVHVFHWWPDHNDRHSLRVGVAAWARYLATLRENQIGGFASLEFLPDDAPEQLEHEAQTLRRLLAGELA